ncbi:MAG: hypothetical protein A2Y33_05760 [Spirochaetes bacterium GWF1_51_8]|nr:MAG: hypothetical protein A2Y33_05760 [Spirochaetes bacterium GWF1_51_8]
MRAVIVYLILSAALPLYPAVFEPGSPLSVYETKHFEIVFTPSSQAAAAELASYADSVYEQMTAALPTLDTQKITVVLTADYYDANGFSRTVPYNHILLYAYPPEFDGSIGNYSHWLKDLFTHELAHAVSLNIRSPFVQALSSLFGPWVQTQVYMMPWFMVEGVTVSFESLGGFGRANNPLVIAQLQQNIIENKFKDTAQASGAFDLYPGGNIHYHYGGMFSRFLQLEYGMEKYGKLWQTTGNGNIFAILPGSFAEVYGVSVYDEWELFRQSLAPKFETVFNTNKLLPEIASIPFAVQAGGKIVYADQFLQLIREYDPASDMTSDLFGYYYDIVSMNASSDGTLLVLNRYALENTLPVLFAEFYSLAGHSFTGPKYAGVREASFFQTPGGSPYDVTAIRVLDRYTDLVLIVNGAVQVLIEGDYDTYYGHPKQLDTNRIVFILKDKGTNSLAVYSLADHQVTVYRTPGMEFRYIRDISVTGGKVWFSYGESGGLYKAGYTDLATASLQTNNISGGVYSPLPFDNTLFYVAQFSEGSQLMKIPGGFAALPSEVTMLSGSPYTPSKDSPVSDKAAVEAKPYHPLGYLVPHVWMPYLVMDGRGAFETIGFISYLADPIRNNQSVMPTVLMNVVKPFADIELEWDNSAFPVQFSLYFRDWVDFSTYYDDYYRQTAGSFNLWYLHTFTPQCNYFLIGAGISHNSFAFDNRIDSSPYYWKYTSDTTLASLYLNISTFTSLYRFYHYRGWTLGLYGDYNIQKNRYKAEFAMTIAPYIIPLVIGLNGAYSDSPVLNTSSANNVFWGNRYPVFREYTGIPIQRNYYLALSASFPVFDIEIQWGPGLIPVYFNRFYLLMGYRAAWLEPLYLHSAYARLKLVTTFFANLDFSIYAEGYYAFNYSTPGFTWGMSFDLWFLSLGKPGAEEKKIEKDMW